MKTHCEILGFSIEPDLVCSASGNHPLCRKCRGRDQETRASGSGKRRARRRCECGRVFFSKSNRQKRCERCRKWNDNQKTRIRMARFRRKPKTRSVVTI